jgi:hypothetical protein
VLKARMNTPPTERHRLWVTASVSALTVVVLAPIVFRLAGSSYDHVIHRNLALAMKAHLTLYTPHILLQCLVLGLSYLLPGDIDLAMSVVMLLAYATVAAAVAQVILRRTSSAAVVCGLTLALVLASSAAFLFPLDRHLYFGYVPANVFHSPTMVLLKPLALLSFGYAASALWPKPGNNARTFVPAALLTVACALAKPSYTVCILPALAVLAAKRAASRSPIDWKLLVFGFFLPAGATLVVQYQWTYSDRQIPGVYAGMSHIVFAPLVVMRLYSSWLGPKLLLSLLFPLSALAVNLRRACADFALMLAWVLVAVGAGLMYLLAETGPRLIQGNLLWSAQIAVFILFVQSAAHISAYFGGSRATCAPQERLRAMASLGCLLLHTAFGVAFYVAEYTHLQAYW